MSSYNRYSCLLIDTNLDHETKFNDLCFKKNKMEDIIDKQIQIISKLKENNLDRIIKDSNIYDSFQHTLTSELKKEVIVIKDSISQLKENHTNPSINFNFINMFDKNELNLIIDNILTELLQNTNYSVIIEDTINSNDFVDGYVLLIKNNNIINFEKIQFIKWLIRQCVISIGTTLGSSKTIFNVNKKNGSIIMYFDIYLTRHNLEDIDPLYIIVNEFNKIISCIGDNDYEVDDIKRITNKISILEKERNLAFNDREKFKKINSELKDLKHELDDDFDSSYKKKGKGSKIRADIFNNRINLIIPYKYNDELTGFEELLYSIIEMMYLLLKKFCQKDEKLTKSKVEMFLKSYFKGTKEKRPLLFLKIIDKPIGIDKKYYVFSSNKLIFVKKKCGEKFQKFIQDKYILTKNINYKARYDCYVDQLQKIDIIPKINETGIEILNYLRENNFINLEIEPEQIEAIAEILVKKRDNFKKFPN